MNTNNKENRLLAVPGKIKDRLKQIGIASLLLLNLSGFFCACNSHRDTKNSQHERWEQEEERRQQEREQENDLIERGYQQTIQKQNLGYSAINQCDNQKKYVYLNVIEKDDYIIYTTSENTNGSPTTGTLKKEKGGYFVNKMVENMDYILFMNIHSHPNQNKASPIIKLIDGETDVVKIGIDVTETDSLLFCTILSNQGSKPSTKIIKKHPDGSYNLKTSIEHGDYVLILRASYYPPKSNAIIQQTDSTITKNLINNNEGSLTPIKTDSLLEQGDTSHVQ